MVVRSIDRPCIVRERSPGRRRVQLRVQVVSVVFHDIHNRPSERLRKHGFSRIIARHIHMLIGRKVTDTLVKPLHHAVLRRVGRPAKNLRNAMRAVMVEQIMEMLNRPPIVQSVGETSPDIDGLEPANLPRVSLGLRLLRLEVLERLALCSKYIPPVVDESRRHRELLAGLRKQGTHLLTSDRRSPAVGSNQPVEVNRDISPQFPLEAILVGQRMMVRHPIRVAHEVDFFTGPGVDSNKAAISVRCSRGPGFSTYFSHSAWDVGMPNSRIYFCIREVRSSFPEFASQVENDDSAWIGTVGHTIHHATRVSDGRGCRKALPLHAQDHMALDQERTPPGLHSCRTPVADTYTGTSRTPWLAGQHRRPMSRRAPRTFGPNSLDRSSRPWRPRKSKPVW